MINHGSVYTSVWVSHLRDGNTELEICSITELYYVTLIVGEWACGNLKDRAVIFSFSKLLPMSIEAEYEEYYPLLKITIDGKRYRLC
jgi:hypothetical protein